MESKQMYTSQQASGLVFVTGTGGQGPSTRPQDPALVQRDPAPNATQPLVPTAPTVLVQIGSAPC
jgi:hypothetical protein